MKRKWIWIAAVVLLVGSLAVLSDSKGMAVNHVLRNQHKLVDHAIACMEEPESADRYASWETEYRSAYDVVLFQVRYTGFGSQSDERGFYYSPQDTASGLGNDLDREPVDEGIKFYGEGDNYTYVEKITDRWYWYEMHW